jgi:hypothetical protein
MPSRFLSELTIFHEEQAIAQRYFFGYLTIRNKAAEDKELLGAINRNPWFWSHSPRERPMLLKQSCTIPILSPSNG